MNTLSPYENKKKSSVPVDMLRQELMRHAKDFKTSWTALGQGLYPVWKDKLFYSWGYEKFENYTEQEEPLYLKEDYAESRQPLQVPALDAINVLRLAKQNKELNRDDYIQLRKAVFEKGKDATLVRKDLTALIKERKPVDPDEERERRSQASIRKLAEAISTFEKDMEALKLIPAEVVEEAKKLLKRLKEEIDEEE